MTNVASAEMRNRKQHGRGCPEIAQEQQDHETGQRQADQTFVQHRIDGFLHEDRLIEKQVGLHLLRNVVQMSERLRTPSTT